MKKLALTLCLALAVAPAALAYGNSHVKVSLWDRIAAAAPHNNIDEVSGLDLGIGSTAEHISGVQLDLIYANAKNDFDGVQLAWIYATTPEFKGWQASIFGQADTFQGLQSGLINYTTQGYTGVQWGGVNVTNAFTGAQAGFVNYAQEGTGLQFGFVNYAKAVTGLQLGFVNYTENIHGLQIGLANIAKNGFLPAMIFVNGRF